MSDRTLDKLISTLKSEAIDAAENASKKIVEDANIKAKKILKGAEQKREQILLDAEKEAKTTLIKGESALRQAARDVHVSVQNELLELFKTVLEKEVHSVFTPNLIKSAVVKVIENIGSEVELKLSPAFEQELADHIHRNLKTSEDLVSITNTDTMLNQLSIKKTDEGWSYDISPEEVAELLNIHLSGKWIAMLENGAET